MSYATVTVNGPTYRTPTGALARGYVSIRPTVARVTDQDGNTVMSGSVRVALVDGTFTVELPATDDPNLSPEGFGFLLSEHLTHTAATEPPLRFLLPAAVSPVDLLDVAELDPSTGPALEWRSAFRTEMEALRADVIDVSGIDDTDSAVAALIDTPAGPLTQAALSATLVTRDAYAAEAVKTPATLIDGGKSVTAWKRFVSGGATITAQTDEPTPYYRIATAGGAVGQVGRDVNLNLSGGRFLTMEVRARDANLKTLYVNLGAGNWAASKIFAWPQGQNGQAVQPFGWFTSGVAGAGYKFVNQPNYDVMEWHTLVVTLDATNKVGGATVADAANIRSLYLSLTPGAVAACDVDVRNIQVHDPSPKQPSGGSVIWQWDDGFVTTRTIGLPALQAAGMVGSLAVDWNVITGAGHTSNYMTLAQVQELYAAGWDMHGHDTGDQTLLSDAQFETAQRAVVDFMRNNGLVRGSSYYVWPQGYRTTAKDAIRKIYFPRGARRVIPWSSGAAPYVTDSTQMGQFYVTPAKTLAQAKAAIDLAQTYNSVVHFILHDLVASGATAENWLISDFEALVAYADSVGIKSTTMSRLYGE